MSIDDPQLAFVVPREKQPALEVRVNFGVFAGRHATPAEIDELALSLKNHVPTFAILSEERHEFGDAVEASVHQVVVEVPREHAAGNRDALAEQIVTAANGWAIECIASRHGPGQI
jgi:hypothetical protein